MNWTSEEIRRTMETSGKVIDRAIDDILRNARNLQRESLRETLATMMVAAKIDKPASASSAPTASTEIDTTVKAGDRFHGCTFGSKIRVVGINHSGYVGISNLHEDPLVWFSAEEVSENIASGRWMRVPGETSPRQPPVVDQFTLNVGDRIRSKRKTCECTVASIVNGVVTLAWDDGNAGGVHLDAVISYIRRGVWTRIAVGTGKPIESLTPADLTLTEQDALDKASLDRLAKYEDLQRKLKCAEQYSGIVYREVLIAQKERNAAFCERDAALASNKTMLLERDKAIADAKRARESRDLLHKEALAAREQRDDASRLHKEALTSLENKQLLLTWYVDRMAEINEALNCGHSEDCLRSRETGCARTCPHRIAWEKAGLPR